MSTLARDGQSTVTVEAGSNESERPDEATAELTREDVFEVLSNRRRRYALHYLKQLEDGEIAELSELSSQVAAWESGVDVDAVTYDDRKSVQTSMYQFHLPKLQEKAVIEYDKRSGEIRRTDAVDTFDLYLETVPESEISWSLYFLLLSVGAVGIGVGAWTDAIIISQLSATAWLMITAVTFFVTSVVYAYHHRFEMRVGSEGPPPEACE